MEILKLMGGEYHTSIEVAADKIAVHEITSAGVDRIVCALPITPDNITRCDAFCEEHTRYTTRATDTFNEIVLAIRRGEASKPYARICGHCQNLKLNHGTRECCKVRADGVPLSPREDSAIAETCSKYEPFPMNLI